MPTCVAVMPWLFHQLDTKFTLFIRYFIPQAQHKNWVNMFKGPILSPFMSRSELTAAVWRGSFTAAIFLPVPSMQNLLLSGCEHFSYSTFMFNSLWTDGVWLNNIVSTSFCSKLALWRKKKNLTLGDVCVLSSFKTGFWQWILRTNYLNYEIKLVHGSGFNSNRCSDNDFF